MKCPGCKRVLKKMKVGAVALDICQGGCGGIWFDGEELDKVAKSIAGVIMDRCPKCAGIWLDHGELETIREETAPTPHPVRHVVERSDRTPMSVPINFRMVREVQRLRISVS